jgi:Ser/Thr protein kinase RdoA (MazF antagonist)
MRTWNDMQVDEHLCALHELALEALPFWGLGDAALTLIKYRENAVYQVRDDSGRRYALRIHRAGYHSDAGLQSELAWMTSLQQAGIDVPRLIPTSGKASFIKLAHPTLPLDFQIDLFEWVNGTRLGSSEQGLDADADTIKTTYFTVGELAARLHNHASAWVRPKGFERHSWDAEGLLGDAPFWGCFWQLQLLSPAQRDLMVRARAKSAHELRKFEKSPASAGTYGLIHADLVPENLLADGEHVRLIDFDDCGFGWHLFELASALYFIQDDRHFDIARTALIAGYRQHRALTDATLAYLPLFMLLRSFTYLGWMHTRSESQTAPQLASHLIGLACRLAQQFVGESEG